MFLSVHQQKSLPALRLSLLNSQQSLTQPPQQQGVKTAPGGTPPAMVTGPAVRIHHPNSVSTTGGASALPTGTLGHAGAMVCMMQTCLPILFWTVITFTHLNMKLLTVTWNRWNDELNWMSVDQNHLCWWPFWLIYLESYTNAVMSMSPYET